MTSIFRPRAGGFRRASRIAVGLVVAALGSVVLAGCTPREAGTIGVARDAAGQLVVVTDGCGEDLDYVSFTRTADGGPTGTATNGQLLYDRTELGNFELSNDERNLTTIGSVPELEDGVFYSVGAWNDSQSVSAGPIRFRVEDIRDLEVGDVYAGSASENRPSENRPSGNGKKDGSPRLTVEQWLAAACVDKR